MVEQIELAFAGVQSLNEPYVLLCGEANDDYLSQEVLDVMAAREYDTLLMKSFGGCAGISIRGSV